MSEWWNLKSAIASIDSKLDKAMGVATPKPSDLPDPTPIKPVESFEFPEDQLQFLDLYQTRFESLGSKIRHLVNENEHLLAQNKADPAAATAKKIDLLLEEGTRLSAQELKLNSTIKKLKRQLVEASKPEAQLNTTTQELESLRSTSDAKIKALEEEIKAINTKFQALQRDLDESHALGEFYKSQSAHHEPAGPTPRQLESLTQNHEEARENWLTVESRLLSTIANLESSIDARDSRIKDLNSRIQQAQANAQDHRDSAEKHRISLSESHTKHDELKQQLADTQASHQAEIGELKEQLKCQREEIKELRIQQEKSQTDASEPMRQYPQADASSPHQHSPLDELTPIPSTMPEQMYDDIAVPPLEPLELGLGHIHDVCPTPNDSIDESRLDISALGSVASMEVDTHLVAKLSQANRKLEAQLLMTQKSLEQTRKEKESAYSEMVKYMSSGDPEDIEKQNVELSAKIEKLLVKLGQKTEQVTELQADVTDLKEMYKEQVTELVEQIQALKK